MNRPQEMGKMFGLTYDLWKDIISDIASAHESLFSAMHEAALKVDLTAELIEELKKKRELPVASDPVELSLRMDLLGDGIGGFTIFLEAREDLSVMEQIKADLASDQGLSLEDIEAFEMDSGLDLQEDILTEMEESFGVQANVDNDGIIYQMVIFDSQDIDDSRNSDLIWQDDTDN